MKKFAMCFGGFCFVAGCCAATMLGAGGQPAGGDRTINAQRYEMTDPEGRVRGEWFVDKSDTAVFKLRTPAGDNGVVLSAGKSESSIFLADAKGQPRCSLTAGSTGASFQLRDADQVRIELVTETDRSARFRIYDKAGKLRFVVSQQGKDQSAMQILDADGKVVWSALEAKP